jgi:hypothetical protein
VADLEPLGALEAEEERVPGDQMEQAGWVEFS